MFWRWVYLSGKTPCWNNFKSLCYIQAMIRYFICCSDLTLNKMFFSLSLDWRGSGDTKPSVNLSVFFSFLLAFETSLLCVLHWSSHSGVVGEDTKCSLSTTLIHFVYWFLNTGIKRNVKSVQASTEKHVFQFTGMTKSSCPPVIWRTGWSEAEISSKRVYLLKFSKARGQTVGQTDGESRGCSSR